MSHSKPRRRGVMRSYWEHLKGLGGLRTRSLAVIGTASLLAGFCEATLIFLVIRIALVMSAGGHKVELPDLIGGSLRVPLAFGIAAALLLLLLSLNYISARKGTKLAARVVHRARRRMLASFLDARYDVQAVERPSRLQELMSSHVNRVGAASIFFITGVTAALSFCAFVVSAVLVSPFAALIIAVASALFGGVLLPLTRLTRRRSKQLAQLNANYADSVSLVVASAREIRVFDAARVIQDELSVQSHHTAAAGYQQRLLARMTPVVYQTVALLVLLVCLAGAYAFEFGQVGDLSAVVVLLVRAISYGQNVNTAIQQVSEAGPYLTDMLEKEQYFAEAQAKPGTEPTPHLQQLAFRDVGYRYPTGGDVIEGLTFSINRGQKVGIVGPSGSGKSTLLQLILRLREPVSGVIEVNGLDISTFDYASWFERLAFVPQDNVLIPGTVADNIRFYRSGISDDDVLRAAQLAHLHNVVTALPDGYETLVGPGYQDLSGGQRQRLGLARAFAGRPDLIILDEPTSALDMDSEQLVQQTLQSLGDDVTLFIVAHRLSTLNDCDVVLVLEDGRLVAAGTHAELSQGSDFYRRAVALSTLPL